ncbi:MAG TPA: type II toxin-antitoxin system Y4mF family antitoxin [Bacteroidota bacterium]|nr:type II toxin-antitoxin system Y4mF family antitoxin [Bacteroidota bacterium]
MSNIKNLASILRYHRKKAGLTQQELAKLAGVGKTVVFDLEKGKETVQLDTLKKILLTLNITLKLDSPLMQQYEREGDRETS